MHHVTHAIPSSRSPWSRIKHNHDVSHNRHHRHQQQQPEQARRERLQQRMRGVIARFNATMAGRAKLIFIGQGRAGKTSTFHSLMGHMFNKHEHSTHGAASTDLAVIVESMDVHDWQVCE